MKVKLDCIPCFSRQAAETARAVAPDDWALQQKVVKLVCAAVAEADFDRSPPEISAAYFRDISALTGCVDPYRKEKLVSNAEVLALLPALQQRIADSDRPLEMAVRMAIAGNIIDFGTPQGQKDNELLTVIEHALESELCMDAFATFQQRARDAKLILYLGDNCGEAVMDRLLIEQLPTEKVVYAVRGGPILNDITPVEAREIGMDQLCRVVDNGDNTPGTVLRDCSAEFQALYQQADMIISKGQGNYETLEASDREIFFLLKVKCDVVAEQTGQPLGSIIFKRNG